MSNDTKTAAELNAEVAQIVERLNLQFVYKDRPHQIVAVNTLDRDSREIVDRAAHPWARASHGQAVVRLGRSILSPTL